MHIVQLAVLNVEAVAAFVAAVGEQHAFGSAVRNADLDRDAVGAIDHVDGGVAGDDLGAWKECVAVARRRRLRSWILEARRPARIDGQDIVATGLSIPERDHLDQFITMQVGHIVVLSPILVHMIEFPAMIVQADQIFGIERSAEELARFGE